MPWRGARTGWLRGPDDIEAFVEAVTIYHLLIEGTIAVSAQHFILSRLDSEGTLPGFVEGFTNVSRDEHRHVAFVVRFLHDAAATGHADTVRRTVAELEPTIDDLILPRREQLDDDVELLGATIGKRRVGVRLPGRQSAAHRGDGHHPECGQRHLDDVFDPVDPTGLAHSQRGGDDATEQRGACPDEDRQDDPDLLLTWREQPPERPNDHPRKQRHDDRRQPVHLGSFLRSTREPYDFAARSRRVPSCVSISPR
jgi:hypothetical protein